MRTSRYLSSNQPNSDPHTEWTHVAPSADVTYGGDPLLEAVAKDAWREERKKEYVLAQERNQKGVAYLNDNKECTQSKLFVATALQVYSENFLESRTPIKGTHAPSNEQSWFPTREADLPRGIVTVLFDVTRVQLLGRMPHRTARRGWRHEVLGRKRCAKP